MLSVAERKGVYRSCIEADLTRQLDIGDDSYDAIISAGTFTHSHVGPNGLGELVRITRPGGLICIAVNAQVFDVDGYPAKFSELSGSGRPRLTDCVDIEYLRNERIDAKVALLRRDDD